jgi:hypothetical protein
MSFKAFYKQTNPTTRSIKSWHLSFIEQIICASLSLLLDMELHSKEK